MAVDARQNGIRLKKLSRIIAKIYQRNDKAVPRSPYYVELRLHGFDAKNRSIDA